MKKYINNMIGTSFPKELSATDFSEAIYVNSPQGNKAFENRIASLDSKTIDLISNAKDLDSATLVKIAKSMDSMPSVSGVQNMLLTAMIQPIAVALYPENVYSQILPVLNVGYGNQRWTQTLVNYNGTPKVIGNSSGVQTNSLHINTASEVWDIIDYAITFEHTAKEITQSSLTGINSLQFKNEFAILSMENLKDLMILKGNSKYNINSIITPNTRTIVSPKTFKDWINGDTQALRKFLVQNIQSISGISKGTLGSKIVVTLPVDQFNDIGGTYSNQNVNINTIVDDVKKLAKDTKIDVEFMPSYQNIGVGAGGTDVMVIMAVETKKGTNTLAQVMPLDLAVYAFTKHDITQTKFISAIGGISNPYEASTLIIQGI